MTLEELVALKFKGICDCLALYDEMIVVGRDENSSLGVLHIYKTSPKHHLITKIAPDTNESLEFICSDVLMVARYATKFYS